MGVLLVLIAYGSLYPFTWHFDRPREFIFFGPVGRVDLIENIVLFMPLGYVLAWDHRATPRRVFRFLWWLGVCTVFAGMLQWLQVYLPRTPALSDVCFNVLGYVLGWCIGQGSAELVTAQLARHTAWRQFDRMALMLVLIWILAELFPLIPALDVSTVWRNVKSLWLQEAWQPRRMLEHVGMTVIGLESFGVLLRSAGARHAVRLKALCLALLVLIGKFAMAHQSPGVPVVCGIVLGGLGWLLVDHLLDRARAYVVLSVATLSYLIHSLAPYTWVAVPGDMNWIPFQSSLQGGIDRVGGTVAFEALCFAAIVWNAVRLGASAVVFTVFTALLALGCEALQLYLPGRTAETTSAVVALGAGWLVAATSRSAVCRAKLAHLPGTRHA